MVWTARTILSLPDAASAEEARHELAQEEERGGAVARVELVAHAERALDDGFERNAGTLAERLGDHRDDLVLHQKQPVPDALVIHAVVQAARIAAFVDVAAGDIAERPVLHHEHRHGSGVDAGKRSDAAEIVAAADLDLAGIELGDGLIPILGEVLEQGAADDGVALAAGIVGPRHRRT